MKEVLEQMFPDSDEVMKAWQEQNSSGTPVSERVSWRDFGWTVGFIGYPEGEFLVKEAATGLVSNVYNVSESFLTLLDGQDLILAESFVGRDPAYILLDGNQKELKVDLLEGKVPDVNADNEEGIVKDLTEDDNKKAKASAARGKADAEAATVLRGKQKRAKQKRAGKKSLGEATPDDKDKKKGKGEKVREPNADGSGDDVGDEVVPEAPAGGDGSVDDLDVGDDLDLGGDSPAGGAPALGDEEEDGGPEDVEAGPPKTAEIEKQFLGKTADTYFYFVTTSSDADVVDDMQVVDQDGDIQFSAKDKGIEISDEPVDFLKAVYQELKIEDISRDVFLQYFLPGLERQVKDEEENVDKALDEPEDVSPGADDVNALSSSDAPPLESICIYKGVEYKVKLVEGGLQLNENFFEFSDHLMELFKEKDKDDWDGLAKGRLSLMNEAELAALFEHKLVPGKKYDIDTFELAGWFQEDGTEVEVEGYDFWNYFDDDGVYKGPDQYGIEPRVTFEDMSEHTPDLAVGVAQRLRKAQQNIHPGSGNFEVLFTDGKKVRVEGAKNRVSALQIARTKYQNPDAEPTQVDVVEDMDEDGGGMSVEDYVRAIAETWDYKEGPWEKFEAELDKIIGLALQNFSKEELAAALGPEMSDEGWTLDDVRLLQQKLKTTIPVNTSYVEDEDEDMEEGA